MQWITMREPEPELEVRKLRESKAKLVRKRNASEVEDKQRAEEEEALNAFRSGDWPIAEKESEVTAAIAGAFGEKRIWSDKWISSEAEVVNFHILREKNEKIISGKRKRNRRWGLDFEAYPAWRFGLFGSFFHFFFFKNKSLT